MDTFQVIQVIVMIFGLVVAVITAIFIWGIGIRQNEINQQALNVNDFAEIFLMPQEIRVKMPDGSEKIDRWNILIKNSSAYPVYLNAYTLNGVKHDVGSSAIPNNPESWFTIPIPSDIVTKKEFSLIVDFEDYRGKRYQTEGSGAFGGSGWGVKSKKRVEVK